ncbi:MAG: hypothetical protein KGL69_02780 [Alphaproteobacteria bacterium]|nr:hypothetical protein [Alphaproteobacteria bacterium]
MHIHRPKPVHSLAEFASEIAVIAVGILIALAGEQLLEALHWRHVVEVSRAAIRIETQANLEMAADRVMTAPCLKARISALDAKLRRPGPWIADPLPDAGDARFAALPSAYVPTYAFYVDGHWKTAVSNGALTHMSEAERNSDVYNDQAVQGLIAYAAEEETQAAGLQPLAQDQSLSPADRLAFERVLARLDALNVNQVVYARKYLEGNRRAGLSPDPRRLASAYAGLRAKLGACVTPLGSTEDALPKGLSAVEMAR